MPENPPQFEMFHEDIYDALRTCVQALGGAKKVGASLWPDLSPDKAGNRLNDSLNTAKRDVLNPQQVVYLLRKSRQAGCHVAMDYIATECDYESPRPVEPLDEMAKLQRESIAAVKQLESITARLEHMQRLREVSNG